MPHPLQGWRWTCIPRRGRRKNAEGSRPGTKCAQPGKDVNARAPANVPPRVRDHLRFDALDAKRRASTHLTVGHVRAPKRSNKFAPPLFNQDDARRRIIITLKSIAHNPEIKEGMCRKAIDAAIAKYADQETLYDQPTLDKSKASVSGPFTVGAVPASAVCSLSEVTAGRPSDPNRDREGAAERAGTGEGPLPDGRGSECTAASVADSSVGRSGETLR